LGTIRGDFGLEMGRNLIHASDSAESAEKEVGLFFQAEELYQYDRARIPGYLSRGSTCSGLAAYTSLLKAFSIAFGFGGVSGCRSGWR